MIGFHKANRKTVPDSAAELFRLKDEEEAERRWAAFFRNPGEYAAARHARRTADDFAEQIARMKAEAVLRHQQDFASQVHSE